MKSRQFASPNLTTHSSRGLRVSGHAQQIFLPEIGETGGPEAATAGAATAEPVEGEEPLPDIKNRIGKGREGIGLR